MLELSNVWTFERSKARTFEGWKNGPGVVISHSRFMIHRPSIQKFERSNVWAFESSNIQISERQCSYSRAFKESNVQMFEHSSIWTLRVWKLQRLKAGPGLVIGRVRSMTQHFERSLVRAFECSNGQWLPNGIQGLWSWDVGSDISDLRSQIRGQRSQIRGLRWEI